MLNNLINRSVYKIFIKVFDKDVICNSRQYRGLHDLDVLCEENHERFLGGLVCWDMLSCVHWQLSTAFYSLIDFL